MNKHVRWLHEQLPAWVTQGVVSPAQADAIRKLYPEPKATLSWGMIIFSGIGAGIWFVENTAPNAKATNAVALQELEQDWNARFRLEYRPPAAEACAGLPNAKLIYHSRLSSRGFNPVGTFD